MRVAMRLLMFVYLVCVCVCVCVCVTMCVNEDQYSIKTVELSPEMSSHKSRIFKVRSVLYFTIVNCWFTAK